MSDADCLISVVIGTYNRAELLRVALKTLAAQTLPLAEYEVIVVDNNSTDETARVVEEARQHLPSLRYCFERKPGISVARNHGWRVARGHYVAFTDDDSRLPAEWLATAKRLIFRHAPAAFGGPYLACYDGPKPPWFKDSYESTNVSDTKGYLVGPNLFLRRYLLEATGGFNPALGIVGKRLGYGEEGALLQVVRQRCPGELIHYYPSFYVYHVVRTEKMRLLWQLYRRFVLGRYFYRVYGREYLSLVSCRQQCLRLLKTLKLLIYDHPRQLVRRNRTQYPYYQHYLVEVLGRDLRVAGGMVEQFQQTITRRATCDDFPPSGRPEK